MSLLRLILAALWLVAVPLAPVAAQDAADAAAQEDAGAAVLLADGTPDYEAWNKFAAQVEAALETGRASDRVWEQLRADLVDWRRIFAEAKDANSLRIDTLTAQLAALGPPPAEGQSEPDVLTERRNELEQQLAAAQLPVQEAQEAWSRADVLIRQIDTLLRAREADALVSQGPLPINPAYWPEALHDITNTFSRALSATREAWGTDAQKAELSRGLPVTILLAIGGLVLLLRGRAWVVRLGAHLARRDGGRRGVVGLLVSLGQVVAPLLGILALTAVLERAGVLDLRAQVIVDQVPLLGLSVLMGLWLGGRIFGARSNPHPTVALAQGREAAHGRLTLAGLGLIYGLLRMLEAIAAYESYDPQVRAVLAFPLLVAGGLLLIRLGGLLRHHAGALREMAERIGLRARLVPMLGNLVIALGGVVPVIAAVGYGSLAEYLLGATILTIGLLALLDVAHQFFVDIYAFFTGKDEAEAQEALLPILASFLSAIASIPALALIWGARVTDLTEMWTRFSQGFTIGTVTITPRAFLTFAVIFAAGYMLTQVIRGALKNTILPKTRLDKGGQNAIAAGVGYLGIVIAAIVAISAAGIDLSSLAIVAGALSVGIGFGLQNVVSNFVSGIILLIERPISEGDWIEVAGKQGYVRSIAVRSTVIETFDRTDVVVPNSDLVSGVVTNYTRGNLIGRVIVPVGVAYGTDTRKVEEILLEIAQAHPLVTVNPAPSVIFQGFGADSLDFEIRAIIKDVNFILRVRSDLNHEIARRFAEAGIEIPFAQRDIWFRNPETLAGALAAGQARASATDPAAPPPRAGQASRPDLRDLPPDEAPDDTPDGTPDGDAND